MVQWTVPLEKSIEDALEQGADQEEVTLKKGGALLSPYFSNVSKFYIFKQRLKMFLLSRLILNNSTCSQILPQI